MVCILLPQKRTLADEPLSPEAAKVQQDEIDRLAREEAQRVYEEKVRQLSIELTQKAEKLKGTKQGQCTVAARNFLGVGRDQIQGYVQTKINSQDPQVGNIIVIVGRMRHAGVVLFSTEEKVVYYDSNGSLNQRANIREIDVDSKLIKGYRDTGIFDL